MLENPQRVDQFTEEIAEMKLPDAASSRERTYLRISVVLMAAGVVAGIVAYVMGHGTTNPLQQRDAIVLALVYSWLCRAAVKPQAGGPRP